MVSRLVERINSNIVAGTIGIFILLFPIAMDNRLNNAFEFPKFLVLRVFVIIFAFIWFLRIYQLKKLTIHLSVTKMLWLVFIIIGTLSSFSSETMRISFFGAFPLYMGFFTYLSLFVLFVLVSELVEAEMVNKLLTCFAIAVSIVSLYAILQRFGIDFQKWTGSGAGRSFATWGTPIALGGFISLSMPINISFLLSAKNRSMKVCITATLVLSLVALLFSLTRGAMLAAIIGLVVFILLSRKDLIRYSAKRILQYAALMCALIGLVIAGWKSAPYDFMTHLFFRGEMGSISLTSRYSLWSESIHLLKERPLLGFGFNTFGLHSLADDKSHNIILDLMVSVGWIGFGFFFAGFIFLLYRSLISVKSSQSRDERILIAGIAAGLLTIMIHLQFSWPTLGILGVFFLFAGLLESRLTRVGGGNKILEINVRGMAVKVTASAFLIISLIYAQALISCFRAELAFSKAFDEGYKGQYTQAAIDIEEAVKMNKYEPYYHELRAIINYFKFLNIENPTSSDFNKTVSVIDDSILFNQWSEPAYFYLISLYLETGALDETAKAKDAFHALLRVDPRTTDTIKYYLLLGKLFTDYGINDSAKEAFSKVLQLRPGNTEATQGLAKIN